MIDVAVTVIEDLAAPDGRFEPEIVATIPSDLSPCVVARCSDTLFNSKRTPS